MLNSFPSSILSSKIMITLINNMLYHMLIPMQKMQITISGHATEYHEIFSNGLGFFQSWTKIFLKWPKILSHFGQIV